MLYITLLLIFIYHLCVFFRSAFPYDTTVDSVNLESCFRYIGFWFCDTLRDKNIVLTPFLQCITEGRFAVKTEVPSWISLENKYPMLLPGGRHKPTECMSRNRVAIIIPFRDREIHLKIFLNNLHEFLQRQQLDYGIFVVEMVSLLVYNSL